ncbi:M13 family metallopeptidase [Xanthomonas sp. 60]
MPAVNESLNATLGMHQHRCRGQDARSRLARNVERFGPQRRPFDLRSIRNQLIFLLAVSSGFRSAPTTPPLRLPAAAPRAPLGSPPQAPQGLLPVAQALESIPMADPADGAPLVQTPVLVQVTNALADTAAATCTVSPRRCGTALLMGACSMALGAIGGWAAASASNAAGAPAPGAPCDPPPHPGPTSARTTYHLVGDALPPAVRFDAAQRDSAVSPCDSLGAHVNGRWEAAMALAPSRSRLGTFEHLRDRSLLVRLQLIEQIAAQPLPTAGERLVADLWVGGMDEARIEAAGRTPIQPTLDAIDALEDNAALFGWLTEATLRARNPLFEFTVQPDQADPSRHTAYLAQGGLGLPDSAWYTDPAHAPTVAAYRTHIARMLTLTGLPHEEAVARAATVFALEQDLAAASVPFHELAVDDSVYHNLVDADEAASVTPHMPWATFFAAHGQPAPARFSLGMPGFFQRVDALLQTVPLRTWKDYLRFHAVDRAAPALSSAYADAHAAFHDRVLKGRSGEVPRWARVLDMIERSAGEALGPGYVALVHPPETAAAARALIQTLRAALDRRLADSAFMGPEARAQARLKASRMRIEVGQPSTWHSWEGVDSTREDFSASLQAADAHVHRRNIQQLQTPVTTGSWRMTPQTVDAYHDMLQNHIVLPAALLQPPLFDPEADAALNYAGLGVILGHEMAHAFDAMGNHIDADGVQRDWLPPTDRARFDALASRLIEQFDAFTIGGHRIDGALTLDENLADLGGLGIALEAMRQATAGTPDPMIDGMTREQRFFANFAFTWRSVSTPERLVLELATNTHVPGRVRADGAPSNLPDYAQAFNCTEGQPMARSPADRVAFP